MLSYPIGSLDVEILVNGYLEDMSDRLGHHLLDISHPVLHISVSWVNLLDEVNLLLLSGDHCPHGVIIVELKIGYSLEYLSEMGSHIPDLLGLGQDFQELIVGQEIESGENRSLFLEVVSKTFLHDFQVLVGFNELLFQALLRANEED